MSIDSYGVKMNTIKLLLLSLILYSCANVYTSRSPAQLDLSCKDLVGKIFEIRTSRILSNAGLDNTNRIAKAEELLETTFSNDQRQALIQAHEIGNGELGLDGINEAGITRSGSSNFTQRQLDRKTRLLKKASFSSTEIRKLFDNGLAGKSRYDGITAEQRLVLKQQEAIFKQEVIPNIPQYAVKKIPENNKLKYHSFYSGIRDFLDEPKKVFERVKDLEIEALRRKNKRPNDKMQDIVEEILSEKEKKHGFKPTIDLENKAYNAQDWWAMLRDGALFNDTSFRSDAGVRSGHGELTHRIQWYAVMREIEVNPKRFRDGNNPLPETVEVYKFMGSLDVNPSYQIESRDLWFTLFDAFSGTFHQPEYFHPAHKYWEAISWQ